jgi:hypothetical protein
MMGNYSIYEERPILHYSEEMVAVKGVFPVYIHLFPLGGQLHACHRLIVWEVCRVPNMNMYVWKNML